MDNSKRRLAQTALAAMFIGFALPTSLAQAAVTPTEIEQIRALNLLSDQHTQKLRQYVAEQFESMVQKEDAAKVDQVSREVIREMMDDDKVRAHRARGMSPEVILSSLSNAGAAVTKPSVRAATSFAKVMRPIPEILFFKDIFLGKIE